MYFRASQKLLHVFSSVSFWELKHEKVHLTFCSHAISQRISLPLLDPSHQHLFSRGIPSPRGTDVRSHSPPPPPHGPPIGMDRKHHDRHGGRQTRHDQRTIRPYRPGHWESHDVHEQRVININFPKVWKAGAKVVPGPLVAMMVGVFFEFAVVRQFGMSTPLVGDYGGGGTQVS